LRRRMEIASVSVPSLIKTASSAVARSTMLS
jgi:hypothetical protein